MGAEARANRARIAAGGHAKGNPPSVALGLSFIERDKVGKAIEEHGIAFVRFSDRAYVVTPKGQLRRVPPSVELQARGQ